MAISIIICTYNPDIKILDNVFSSLKKALNYIADYEVLVIDNNSSNNFLNDVKISSYLNNDYWKVISESKQGLTPARLRGIVESKNELICFIDDDNFVEEDFFQKGLEIAIEYPFIGAFSGQVILDLEYKAEKFIKPYLGLLVRREFSGNYWSNLPENGLTMPCGAGLFVRKNVADYYVYLHDTGKRVMQLDRSGNSLLSGGDNDLAECAIDLGLGVGLFEAVKLKHYIPKSRIQLKYLLKLNKAIGTSSVVLYNFRNRYFPIPTKFAVIKAILVSVKRGPIYFKFFWSNYQGIKIGYSLIKSKK